MKMIKKLFFAAALCLSATAVQAQSTPHALGIHAGGSSLDLEYQYHLSRQSFLDFTAGVFDLGDGFVVSGTYNRVLKAWNWTPDFATWKFWGGLGATVGGIDAGKYDGFMAGPTGVLGFGFTLKEVPITIGLDYRPTLLLVFGDGVDIASAGFRNLGVTLTYRF